MEKDEFWNIFLVVLGAERRLGKIKDIVQLPKRIDELAKLTLTLTQEAVKGMNSNSLG